MPRQPGRKNDWPNLQDRSAYLNMLRDKAKSGDSQAAGWLLFLDNLRRENEKDKA